ncbi:S8 family peptidase [Pseudarthrobacter sp. NS4]|uniref:S8 family peptidase n=1 Tax=Pseudarthrobacter sp. NS4 TaxID=2973976 RepID=UPI002163FF52|nr:S8 family serine peptidase [Pseudarthrobacter sp. NS4]
MKQRLTGIILAGFLLAASGVVVPVMAAAAAETPSLSDSLSGGDQRYIVKYGSEVNAEAETQSLKQQGIEVKETLTHTMQASVVVASPEEIETLGKSADVTSIELDTRVSISGATSIWGIDRIDQRSGRDGLFSLGDEGAGVNVYVVDSGLNFSHTDFAGRVPTSWWGIHDGRAANDCAGHGTHVAGSVAGTTYGVAKKANIIPVRVLDCNGSGWSSTVMAGIDWAVAHHPAGQPAVMNLSIGGFTNWSFDQAVQGAVNDGITVVAAAGNDGVDACWASPARVPTAITVAATNINDAQASWSNYGSCVDLHAPGVWIRSAWTNAPTGYNTLDGTSMAAPHVAGAAAVLLSRDRSLSPAQVHQAMIVNATTGVVSAIKGPTPNRLLFIPGPALNHPSCANLKLGDAWSGIGTHCGLKGSATSVDPTATEPAMGVAEAPVPAVTAIEAPASVEAPATVPATDTSKVPPAGPPVADVAPAPVAVGPPPGAGEPASAQAGAPAEQVAAASAPHVPAAVKGETAPAEPEASAPVETAEEVTPVIQPTPSRTSQSAAHIAAVTASADAAEAKETPEANGTLAAMVLGMLLGGCALTYAIRRLKSARAAKSEADPAV